MTPRTKKILLLVTVLAMSAGVCLLLCASTRHRKEVICDGLRVEFADNLKFVTEGDIKGYLEHWYGGYVGQRLDSVNLAKVEKILDEQSAILKSEAFTTEDGMLNVRILQREPVLRFQKGGTGFYVDSRGFIFPLQDNSTVQVPVVDGNIPVSCEPGYKGKARTEKEEAWIADMMSLMDYISHDKTWKNGIVQVAVDKDGDIVLVPAEGVEKFIFGAPDEFKQKFDRIAKYYEYIKPARPDSCYTSVNVKYEGQIICRK